MRKPREKSCFENLIFFNQLKTRKIYVFMNIERVFSTDVLTCLWILLILFFEKVVGKLDYIQNERSECMRKFLLNKSFKEMSFNFNTITFYFILQQYFDISSFLFLC